MTCKKKNDPICQEHTTDSSGYNPLELKFDLCLQQNVFLFRSMWHPPKIPKRGTHLDGVKKPKKKNNSVFCERKVKLKCGSFEKVDSVVSFNLTCHSAFKDKEWEILCLGFSADTRNWLSLEGPNDSMVATKPSGQIGELMILLPVKLSFLWFSNYSPKIWALVSLHLSQHADWVTMSRRLRKWHRTPSFIASSFGNWSFQWKNRFFDSTKTSNHFRLYLQVRI